VCVLPGTSIQVLVAVLFSLFFIKVYDIYDPFLDSFAGFSKNIAQWQYFGIFTIVLLLKSEIVEDEDSAGVIFILMVTLFANMLVDVFYIIKAALSAPTVPEENISKAAGDSTLDNTPGSSSISSSSNNAHGKERESVLEMLPMRMTTTAASASEVYSGNS
jgi:hypothetical protein